MLLYQLEQGPVQQSVSKTAMRLRGKVPEKFVNGPELLWGLELYFNAFFDLDTERSHSNGWTYIPYSAVAAYAVLWAFDEDQTERLFTHIKAMDSAHIERLEANRKKDEK